ncbi:MAG: hypothetical protein WDO73_06535 [Ignavibacteriota bacterium]
MVFFTFSTTQEYYSMPCYPALALLLGSAMAEGGTWIRRGTRVLAVVAGLAGIACIAILVAVRGVPSPGDISQALSRNPGAYTLSLGHMEDLTLDSFAYLRLPLALAAVAFLIGALGNLRAVGHRAFLAATVMMVLFFHAARLAMVVFDPYLSSRPLATALERAPQGTLVVDHHYYTYSSVFFYLNRSAWLLNGPIQQSGLRVVCARRPEYLSGRRAVAGSMARAAAVLYRGGRRSASAIREIGGQRCAVYVERERRQDGPDQSRAAVIRATKTDEHLSLVSDIQDDLEFGNAPLFQTNNGSVCRVIQAD